MPFTIYIIVSHRIINLHIFTIRLLISRSRKNKLEWFLDTEDYAKDTNIAAGQTLTPRHTIDAILGLNARNGGETINSLSRTVIITTIRS